MWSVETDTHASVIYNLQNLGRMHDSHSPWVKELRPISHFEIVHEQPALNLRLLSVRAFHPDLTRVIRYGRCREAKAMLSYRAVPSEAP